MEHMQPGGSGRGRKRIYLHPVSSVSQVRMAELKAALLLLMLVLSTRAAPTPEECQNLTKTLSKEELQKVDGDWVLVWLNADANTIIDSWKNINSSHVQNRVRPGVVDFTQRNRMSDGVCMTFNTNMASSEGQDHLSYSSGRVETEGNVFPFQDNAIIKFYKTCDDCIMMEYSGLLGRLLFIYRRDGLHQNMEVLTAARSDSQKLAECLGLLTDQPFIYDGVSDFCHKKSAPEVKPEEA